MQTRRSSDRRAIRGRRLRRKGTIVRRGGGGGLVLTTYLGIYEQGYRIADASLALYELFVGVGGPPDFTSPPVATSPTLPLTWTPGVSTGTLYVVVRQTNKYGLASFNVFEEVIQISAGVEVPGPISAPTDVAVYDSAPGFVNVISKYTSVDDANPADMWVVYAKVGVDPVPGTDSPVFTGSMTLVGIETALAQVVGTFTPGTILHVIVQSERSSDGTTASAPVVLHTMALSLDLTDGFMFGGSAFEQQ